METMIAGVVSLAYYPTFQSFLPSDHFYFLLQILLLGGLLLSTLLLRSVRTGREKNRDSQRLIDLDITRQTRGTTRKQRALTKIAQIVGRLTNNTGNTKIAQIVGRLINNTGNVQHQNTNIASALPVIRPTEDNSDNENAIASTTSSESDGSFIVTISNPQISNTITNRRSSLRRPPGNTSNIRDPTSITPKKRVRFADQVDTSFPPTSSSNTRNRSRSVFGEVIPLLPVDRRRTSKPAQTLQMALRTVLFWTILYTRWAARRFMKQTRVLGRKIHAWTMLQPDKVPIIGTEMPTNSISLGIAFMLLVNIVFLLAGLPLDQRFFTVLAHRAAVLHATNTPFLYLLSMKTQPLLSLLWCSHVHLNIFHRRLGELMFFFILIHSGIRITPMVFSVFSEKVSDASTAIYTTHEEALNNISGNIRFEQLRIMTGLLALFALAILFVSSISILRSRNYTRFLYIHVSSQLVAQCLAIIHSPFARPYISVGLAMFVVDRFIFRYCLRTKRLVATARVLQEGQIIQLTIHPSLGRNVLERIKTSLARYIAAPWAPGCHAFLTVKSLPGSHSAKSRPFYLASARDNTDPYFVNQDTLLVVKAAGPWSKTLIREALQLMMDGIVLEGPYGTIWPLEMLRDRHICILVASPSGIGPIISIAQSLVDWENGYHPVSNEFTPRRQQVLIMVISHSSEDLTWYEQKFAFLEGCGIECYIIRSTDFGVDQFAPVTEAIAWEIENRDGPMDKRTGVICCGPRDLQRAVRQSISEARSIGHKCLVDTLSFSDY